LIFYRPRSPSRQVTWRRNTKHFGEGGPKKKTAQWGPSPQSPSRETNSYGVIMGAITRNICRRGGPDESTEARRVTSLPTTMVAPAPRSNPVPGGGMHAMLPAASSSRAR
jgi:hypothetical protein